MPSLVFHTGPENLDLDIWGGPEQTPHSENGIVK